MTLPLSVIRRRLRLSRAYYVQQAEELARQAEAARAEVERIDAMLFAMSPQPPRAA